MKRVAYICADPGVPVWGNKGCSIHVRAVVRAMRKRGLEVTLVVAKEGGMPPPDLADVPIIVFEPGRGATPPEREASALDVARRMAALVDTLDVDLIYERHALWSCRVAEVAQRRGIPMILEVNAPLIDEQARYRGLHDEAAARDVAQRVFAAATTVVAVSEPVARYARTHGASEAHVVPNGVDLESFDPDTHPRPGDFTIGFVGTLRPWHGIPHLATAFERIARHDPRSRLLIVGDGPERPALEERLAPWIAEGRVMITGAIAHAGVAAHLARMHVAVAPYPQLDSFYFSPLKVLEYMAAGRPIVASRIGQIETLLDHERTALLVPPEDPDALADACVRLRRNTDLAQELGHAARREATAIHGWAGVLDRILDLADIAGPALEPAS